MTLRVTADSATKKIAQAVVTANSGTGSDSFAAGNDTRLPGTATTANLVAIGHAINTTGKVAGKMVFNTTTNKPVFAAGATAGALWLNPDATTAHTPA